MSRRLKYLPRQDFDSSTLDGTYQLLGTLAEPVIILKLVNNSTAAVDISTDGETDHDIAPATSFYLYDVRTNKGVEDEFAYPKGMKIYIKGAAGAGNIYLVTQAEAS
jgi:hypothetical protein